MAILQVKGMDEYLYSALRRRAKLDYRSISQEVIAIIQQYLSKPSNESQNVTQEFLKLSGSWGGAESADEIIRDIRKSRKRSTMRVVADNVFD